MIINLKSQTDLSGFYVVYEGSTNLEKKGIYGITHLMEHLMTKNFDHLQESFDKDGIDWNAYTSSNEVVFFITGLDEKVNKWKYKFVDLLGGFDVEKSEFENERNIVLEEYMDSFNDQTASHQMNLYRKLFNNYGPIGVKEDLENLKFMDCLNYFELQYANPSKIINVSKKSDFKSNLINFKERKIDHEVSYSKHDVTYELNNNYKDKTSLVILSPVIDKDFGYVHFINAMLSLGLKSPMYQEIREKKGLVYYIHCYLSRVNDKAIVNIATQTSNKNFNTLVDSIEDVMRKPEEFLTQERFDLIKEYFVVRAKKDEILRYSNVGRWISPEGYSIYDVLDDITIDKVKDVYNEYFNFDDFYISNDRKEFE
jgi:predicted Zn-dependent peptidase